MLNAPTGCEVAIANPRAGPAAALVPIFRDSSLAGNPKIGSTMPTAMSNSTFTSSLARMVLAM
eukprot:3537974-Rhodomonas_salina.1